MFFSENDLSLELIGVFKITRNIYSTKSCNHRNYDSISLRTNGRGDFKANSMTFSVKRGDVLYLPKNAQYNCWTSGETIFAIHFINYSFTSKNQIEIISVENIEYIEELVTEMYNEWKEQKQGYRYKCTSLFYSLIHFLNCQLQKNKLEALPREDKFKTAIDYIHAHFRNEQISVASLAQMCAVSDSYFRKQFKKIYSLSPNQYIISLRLEYASQLLRSRLYTVSEVAEKSGFNDTKYFYKSFKKRFQYSPKEFQKILPEKTWK